MQARRCTVLLVLALLTGSAQSTHAQVSPTLSNLKPTSINESLVPDTGNTIDLGLPTKAWRNIYTAGDIRVGRYLGLPSNLIIHSRGVNNVFVGQFSGLNVTEGHYNTAIGGHTLGATTTGIHNVAAGNGALQDNTSGSYNSATGSLSLSNNTTGNRNVAIGYAALVQNISGYENVAIGSRTLYNNYHGFNNTAIGVNADVSGYVTNATSIGANAIVNASNKVRVGNTVVTSIGGHVSWTSFSDARYKKNIKEDVAGLAFINRLRPVSYTIDIKGLDAFYNKARKQPEDTLDEKEQAAHDQAIEEAAGIIYDGFVAQEVEKAAGETGFAFSGVDKPKNEQDLYGLRYDQFVVPLVKAVQELSAKNDSLQHQMNELKAMMLAGNNSLAAPDFGNTVLADVPAGQGPQLPGASLEQNMPNPFSKATAIPYSLPQKFSTASIIIADFSGKKLRQIILSGEGKGFLKIDAATLPANAYYYSLIIDGKLIATRKMLLNR